MLSGLLHHLRRARVARNNGEEPRNLLRTTFTRDCLASYEIGVATYGCPRVKQWGEGATLRVGSYCSIADNVTIFLGGEHRTGWVTTYPFSVLWKEASGITGHPRTKGDVIIGSDVWIGDGATILSGVKVGDGAVIGARALVSKSVPPYGIAAGNPAKTSRLRFPEVIVDRLLQVRWWDWSESKILSYMDLLLSDDVERFLDAAEHDAKS